jgi:uncharacterized protein (DUF1778 family)
MTTGESVARRSERINLRLEADADDILRAAANSQHQSLSAFILEAALDRAQQVLDSERRLVLQAEEFDRIMDELERSGRAVGPLLRAAGEATSSTRERRRPTPSMGSG